MLLILNLCACVTFCMIEKADKQDLLRKAEHTDMINAQVRLDTVKADKSDVTPLENKVNECENKLALLQKSLELRGGGGMTLTQQLLLSSGGGGGVGGGATNVSNIRNNNMRIIIDPSTGKRVLVPASSSASASTSSWSASLLSGLQPIGGSAFARSLLEETGELPRRFLIFFSWWIGVCTLPVPRNSIWLPV